MKLTYYDSVVCVWVRVFMVIIYLFRLQDVVGLDQYDNMIFYDTIMYSIYCPYDYLGMLFMCVTVFYYYCTVPILA